MLSTSDWDFLHTKKKPPKGHVRSATIFMPLTALERREKYTLAITELMSDGEQRCIKDIAYLIGSGENWSRDYMNANGSRDGRFWRLK